VCFDLSLAVQDRLLMMSAGKSFNIEEVQRQCNFFAYRTR
jgi:hypothetical protein